MGYSTHMLGGMSPDEGGATRSAVRGGAKASCATSFPALRNPRQMRTQIRPAGLGDWVTGYLEALPGETTGG